MFEQPIRCTKMGVVHPPRARGFGHQTSESVQMASTSVGKTTRASRIAVLAGAALFGLAGSALHPALAQTTRADAKQAGPQTQVQGHGALMIAAPATVVSTVHYQETVFLTCDQNLRTCSGDFSQAAPHHQFNVTRISCLITINAARLSNFHFGLISVFNSRTSQTMLETLSGDFSTVNTVDGEAYHTLNSAVDMQVTANQHLHIFLQGSPGDNSVTDTGFCAASGTLDKLG